MGVYEKHADLINFLHLLDNRADVKDFPWCWQVVPEDRRVYHVHWSFKDAVPTLDMEDKNGSAIFVCINETNGSGRKASDIVRVRANFVDLDGAPIEPVYKELRPHMVVQTSPGKYHVYWLVVGEPLEEFKPLQQALAEKFHGDKSVVDLSRVMRVPGYHNHKSEPYLVRLESVRKTFYPYSYQTLKEWLKPKPPKTYKQRPPPASLPPLVAHTLKLLVALDLHKEDKGNGKHDIVCPWEHLHSRHNNGTVYYEPLPDNQWRGGFRCQHGHCAHRTITDLRRFIEAKVSEVQSWT